MFRILAGESLLLSFNIENYEIKKKTKSLINKNGWVVYFI